MRVALFLASFATSAILASQAAGQGLSDPTRPPPTLGQGGYGPASAETTGPVLQSILISPERKIAVVSGKALKVGDKIGDAQLVAIGENEVVLRNGSGKQVLRLYPSLNNGDMHSVGYDAGGSAEKHDRQK